MYWGRIKNQEGETKIVKKPRKEELESVYGGGAKEGERKRVGDKRKEHKGT